MKKLVLISVAMGLVATSGSADTVGLRESQLYMPHHEARAALSVWYPGTGEDETTFAENGVFEGVSVAVDADVRKGLYPVVLFSHGMGGTYRAQAWFARGMVERGAIVVAVNHPNSTWGDFDMAEGVRHWTRAADLSAALDALMADPDFAGMIDPARIMAAGFSYGGWTALSLGGVTGNHAGQVSACADNIDRMEACDVLLSQRVDMQGQDPMAWNASYADSRVRHVAAIDPGFVWGLDGANVAGLVRNTMLIGFGGPDDRMMATDFDASGLTVLVPGAKVVQVDPAFHFTAMPLCKPEGEAILKAENDDPVCTDPPGTNRTEVHARIVDLIAGALDL